MSSIPSGFRASFSDLTSRVVFLLLATLGVVLFSVPLFSQGSNGRILGTVIDQSGGVISGATVTIIDKDRGVARTLTTDDAGEYNAPQLLPGTYTIRAEANGFKKLERENVELGVGKEIRVDLTVQPGTQAQTVTVTEAIPLVETTNATLGGTLQNADINDLPLNGRNFQSLMGLRPGVMLQPGGSPWTQSTNNVRPDESSWMVDGILNANAFDSRPVAGASSPFTDGALILPLDAIQEFNMEENPKAEYGGKPGAMVNVGIRSGTNNLHGSAYAFGRDGSWDARSVFNPPPGPVLPAQLEQFGAAVGGPIKKDKLFFFANYEGLRSNIANAIGTSVPATASGLGADKSMVDAIIGVQNYITAHPGTMVQTGAGLVPLSVSPLSLTLLGCPAGKLTAASTCTGGLIQGDPANTTQYLSTVPNINTSDNGIAKIDYRINDKHMINGTLYKANYTSLGEDFPMVNTAWGNNVLESAWTASGNWIWTASSRVVNEVRVGYNRFNFQFLPADRAVSADGKGYPINTGITSYGGFPTVVISGFGQTQLGSRRGRPLEAAPNPYYDFQDNVSYLLGKHSFKYGFQFSRIEGDSDPHDTRGRINFKGGQAFANATTLEDFFAGLPSDGSQLIGLPAVRLISKMYGVFAQDDWRLTPKLMVNLGLRWSYASPFHEPNNGVGNFDPTSPTGLVQQGQSSVGNTLVKPDYKNFSPRIGFAYDVTGKGTTVVRAGFSILYSMFSVAPFTGNPGVANTPNTSFVNIPTGACTTVVPAGGQCPQTYGGSILNLSPFIPGSTLNWNGVVFPALGVPVVNATHQISIGSVDPNLKTPYVDTWNLGMQHVFTGNLSLDVEYVGTHGGNLIGNVDLNQAPLGAAYCLSVPLVGACAGGPRPASSPSSKAVQQARPYNVQFPYLQFINHVENYARSHYNSLQVTVTERPMHGLSFTGGYTYGHGLDNGSLNRFGGQPMDSTNPGREYSNSDFDIRHRATITASYDIPGKKGFGQLLEGWKVNTIVTLAGSQPWNIIDSSDNFSGTIENTDRWDFFGNPSDFKATSSSIPFCSGFDPVTGNPIPTGKNAVSCSMTSGVSGLVTQMPSSLAQKCTASAPDPATLARAGCYVDGSSVLVPAKLGTYGTMARNIFRDAGFKDVDFSVFKNFKFTERFGAQFRAEFFNVLNHPIIANPFGSVNGYAGGSDPSSSGTFGCGCTTPDVAAGNPIVGSGDAREIQLGLKIMF
jgi:Carboxypeptidase regulatory-like domain/TonB dependent receptor